jgi:hypothetical protein
VAFKLDARPAGLLMYHNTLIGEQAVQSPNGNAHWRNNLFLGRDTPGRGIMTWANATGNYSSDYNGFRPNQGTANQYSWLAPAEAGQTLYYNKPDNWKTFRTLAELQAATGQEMHGIEVDFEIFEKMTPPDPAPAKRHTVYHATDLNFRLKAGTKAVDVGQRLPTVNDGFSGAGPDLGALEVGQPLPHYGPRWITWQPFYR